jgi:hypothetical protein
MKFGGPVNALTVPNADFALHLTVQFGRAMHVEKNARNSRPLGPSLSHSQTISPGGPTSTCCGRQRKSFSLKLCNIPAVIGGIAPHKYALDETRINDPRWATDHVRAIELACSRAPHLCRVGAIAVLHFRRVAAKPLLTNVNEQLLRAGPDPAL